MKSRESGKKGRRKGKREGKRKTQIMPENEFCEWHMAT